MDAASKGITEPGAIGMNDPLWMYKLKNGLLGTPDNYGGLVTEGQGKQSQSSGLMNFGASLLAASGPSREPTSLGQALGPAILQGRQATQQGQSQALQSLLLQQQLKAKQKPTYEKGSPGDVFFDPTTGKQAFSVPSKPAEPLGDLAKLNADFAAGRMSPEDYGMRKKLLLTEKAGTTVNVNTGDKLGGALAGKMGEQYASQYDAAQSATEAIASSERIHQVLKSVPYTGAGAEWKLAIGKAAKAAGFDYAGDDIANTELLAKELGQNVLNSVKSSGLAGSQGLTEGERKFLLQVVGGTITLDDKSLAKIADLNTRVARNSIKKWNSTTQRLPADMLKQLGMGPIEEAPNGGGMGNGWSIVPSQ